MNFYIFFSADKKVQKVQKMNFLNFFCTWPSFRPKSSKSSFFELFLQKNSKSKIPKKFKKFIFRTFSKKISTSKSRKSSKSSILELFSTKNYSANTRNSSKSSFQNPVLRMSFSRPRKCKKVLKVQKMNFFSKNFKNFLQTEKVPKVHIPPPHIT